MCGIAGILKTYQPGEPVPHHLESIPEPWLDILDDSIKHRGPDGQGRFRDRAVRADGTTVDVAFVHRRLSIIDHEGGHQPMVHDGKHLRPDLTYQPGEEPKLAHELCPDLPLVAVVFNGCIYNHRELRAELEAEGHVFETDHSDTEVLIHGWHAWKLELFGRLDAMSALLHWERHSASAVVSRDVAGQKPLYQVGVHTQALAFSSTAPGLWNLHHRDGSSPFELPSPFEVDSWVRFGYEHSTDYGLIPLESLRPGETNRYGNFVGRDRTLRSSRRFRYKFRQNLNSTDQILKKAIRDHLEADVPVSIFLSGGIDSAIIASAARNVEPEIECVTVRMPHPDFDESNEAAQTADHLGLNHRIVDCQPDPTHDLIELIEQLGLPFGDSSLLPTYWVARAARSASKVALSGDGADELFAGYERHRFGPAIHRMSFLPFLGRVLSLPRQDQTAPMSRSSKMARAARAIRHDGYTDLLAIFDKQDARELLGSTSFNRSRLVGSPLDHDFEVYLPNDLLRKTDTASMAVGLEVRAPFLDRDLVYAMRSVRRSGLMPNGQRKGLLKQVARKYLPDHIVDRPKRGFAIPIGEWFRSDYGGMRQLMLDHLRSSDPFPGLGDGGLEINMKFVEQMIREHDAAGEKSINPWHGRDHSQRLYMLLVLSIWSKWLDRTRREAIAQRARDESRA